MGYRDDTAALQSRCELLQHDVKRLEQQLGRLKAQAEGLRQTIRRKRLRIALARLWRWLRGHPKTTTLLVIALIITGLVTVKRIQRAQLRRQQMAVLLGTGCPTRLQVKASRHAAVLVNGLDIGKTPQEVAICPGSYRVQVVHFRMVPWQRVIRVQQQPTIELAADLIPLRSTGSPQGAIYLFSAPPGAVVFVNGQERGRTPLALDPKDWPRGRLRLALWDTRDPSRITRWQGENRSRSIWFNLGRRTTKDVTP